jgi:hypothetical protein
MILHGVGLNTSIRFNPLEPSRVPARWRVRVRVYGRHPLEPVWQHESGVLGWGEQYELTSLEVAQRLGVQRLMHYAELHPYTLDIAPTHEQIVAPVFAHYTSDDGTFSAHLPSSYIYGSARAFKLVGATKYQNFPCVMLGGGFEAEVYTINHNLRKVSYTVITVAGRAETKEYGPYSIRPKSFDVWRSAVDSVPVSAGIIVKSDVRLASFIGTYNRKLGRIVGLDHAHPFFPQ